MSDTPERIWTASTDGKCHVGFDTPSMNYTNEYIRADLAPAAAQADYDARILAALEAPDAGVVAELVDALREISSRTQRRTTRTEFGRRPSPPSPKLPPMEASMSDNDLIRRGDVDREIGVWLKEKYGLQSYMAQPLNNLRAAIAALPAASAVDVRAGALKEAADAIDPAIFDHPSVFMGGPSRQAQRTAEAVRAAILALIPEAK